MDGSVGLIIPKGDNINKIFTKKLVSWGGSNYEQDPPVFQSPNGVEFTEYPFPNFISAYLPHKIVPDEWRYFLLDREYLYEWIDCYDVKKCNANENYQIKLKDFFRKYLAMIDQWVVFFVLDDDRIDEKKCLDENGLIREFEHTIENLNKGFVVWNKC